MPNAEYRQVALEAICRWKGHCYDHNEDDVVWRYEGRDKDGAPTTRYRLCRVCGFKDEKTLSAMERYNHVLVKRYAGRMVERLADSYSVVESLSKTEDSCQSGQRISVPLKYKQC